MPVYVYIHGFNSCSKSRSGVELTRIIGTSIFCPQNDYSRPFPVCLEKLRQELAAYASGAELCVMGTSLGGFYATQLRLPQIRRVIAWNPVVYPALQLKPFVGENERFIDHVKWHFSAEALYSYAAAADGRQWDNFYNVLVNDGEDNPMPKRTVVIGRQDELLDSALCRAYWQNHVEILEIDSGHHIENFDHVLKLLQ